jgi:hypothetical protein
MSRNNSWLSARSWPGLLLLVAPACDEVGARGATPNTSAVRHAAPEAEICEALPAPRWVLRDRDGQRVQALVEPRCGHGPYAPSLNDCISVDFASESDFPCVRIIDHEGMFINLQYELKTGRLEHCQGRQIGSVDDSFGVLSGIVRYLDKDCTGQKYVRAGGGVGYHDPQFTVARDLYLADGDPWYASGKGCLEYTATWNKSGDGTCGNSSTTDICPFERVPTWVQDLLPNPPYTMDVEYE